jgi:hypothetical protein
MSAHPIPEPIAPGQESVWDYPLPPVIRASDEEIIVILGGVEICETRSSLRPNASYAAILDHVGIYAGAMDECLVDGERVVPQSGGYYGGWITSTVTGPFKGGPGTEDW